MRTQQAVVILLALAACGRAERQAAEARADSLQRVLQHQQDSLKVFKAARAQDSLKEAREQDSLAAARAKATAASAKATAAKRQGDSLKAAREKAVVDSVNAERARPRDLILFSSTGLTLNSRSSKHYAFVLDSAADCLVHGRIDVQHDPSSKSDVQVLLLTADDYTNWVSNQQAQLSPLFKAGPQTATTLNVGVTQSGTYNLVISNLFSTFTKKTVQGQVTVTCRGLQPRPL